MINWHIFLHVFGLCLALFSVVFLPKTSAIIVILLVFIVLIGLYLAIVPKIADVQATNTHNNRNNLKQIHIKSIINIETLANALPDSLFILDSHNAIIYLNTTAAETFPSINLEQNYLSRFRAPEIVKALRQARKNHQPTTIDYSDKKYNERFFNVLFVPLKNDYLLAILRNRTETRALERMRSDFIANASHELRTPLTSLRGFIETIKGPAKNDEQAREKFLTIMQEQAERMSRLIDDLLSLSRLETKSGLDANSPILLNTLLAHVVETLSPLAANLKVKLNLSLPKDEIIVAGNMDELIQLFQNLIENACKYGQSGGKVEVSAQFQHDEVEIKIRDYGFGIEEEHIPRLTERFYRAHNKASHTHKGTGLGLAIVKHILTHHHGRLLVQSAVDKGATFIVMLPLKK